MATQIQRRRGTTAQHSTFTGALGELTVDTDKKTVVVHDGITAGGFPLATLASPALTGTPTAPTATAGTNTTQLATTSYAMTAAANAAANAAAGVATTFASSAENAAGTVENKAVDPLGIREAFNASGSAPIYACRAWVNFNGTGTVAIRASGNVSSITDNGAGDYTVNFTTAMPDTNYAAVVHRHQGAQGFGYYKHSGSAEYTSTSYRDRGGTGDTTATNVPSDMAFVNVAIFR